MPKLSYFEYVVLYHFKTKKDNAGNDITEDSKVIVEPTTVMALDATTVGKMAARRIPEEYEKNNELNQCEVIVRPF
jgi:hypothetical protein